jgi:hypothetical protein
MHWDGMDCAYFFKVVGGKQGEGTTEGYDSRVKVRQKGTTAG